MGHVLSLAGTEDSRSGSLMVPNDTGLAADASVQGMKNNTEAAQVSLPGSQRQRINSSSGSSNSETDSMETRCSSDVSSSLDELPKSRREVLIDRLILWMVKWLDSRLSLLALQTHNGGGTAQPPQGSFPAQQTGSDRKQHPSTQRRRTGRDGDQDFDEASDDEGAERSKPNGTVKGDDDEVLEFACPYLKHNPAKYHKLRSCSSYGWKSIHRMK